MGEMARRAFSRGGIVARHGRGGTGTPAVPYRTDYFAGAGFMDTARAWVMLRQTEIDLLCHSGNYDNLGRGKLRTIEPKAAKRRQLSEVFLEKT